LEWTGWQPSPQQDVPAQQVPGDVPQVIGRPAGQVQARATQVAPLGQVRPQPPQWRGSPAVLTQVPGAAPQTSGSAGGHLHAPAEQVAPEAQTSQDAPQAVGSVAVSAQRVPHRLVPAGQRQAPWSHTCVARQAVAQAPQWLSSDWRS
jgi:hypothetical protein